MADVRVSRSPDLARRHLVAHGWLRAAAEGRGWGGIGSSPHGTPADVIRSPSTALLSRKKGTLILSSLLEDLGKIPGGPT